MIEFDWKKSYIESDAFDDNNYMYMYVHYIHLYDKLLI